MAEQQQHEFGVTLKQLEVLMEERGREAIHRLNTDYGSVEGLCQRLNSDSKEGITVTDGELERRRRVFGWNMIPPKAPKTFFGCVLKAFRTSSPLIVLLVSGLVAVLLLIVHASFPLEEDKKQQQQQQQQQQQPLGGRPPKFGDESGGGGGGGGEVKREQEWGTAFSIWCFLAVCVSFVVFPDYMRERLLQMRGCQYECVVVRGGVKEHVPVPNVVVGDVCPIETGELFPADGVIIETNGLKVDESVLSGKGDHVNKNMTSDIQVFAETHVLWGSCRMLVTAVGVSCQSGKLLESRGSKRKGKTKKADKDKNNGQGQGLAVMMDVENKRNGFNPFASLPKDRSLLQNQLISLANHIEFAGFLAAMVTVATCVFVTKKDWMLSGTIRDVLLLDQGLLVLIVILPNFIPLAAAIVFALSVKRMMSDNNLVWHLDACEAIGRITTLCVSKTGGLTMNRMMVSHIFTCALYHKHRPKYSDLPLHFEELLVESISVNSAYTSRLLHHHSEFPRQIGDKTECALLAFVLSIGHDYRVIREAIPQDRFVKVFTFSPVTKCMSTVIPLPGGGYRVHTKGDAEVILKKCNFMFGKEGKVAKISANMQDRLIREVIEPMASHGLRTLAVAYRDFVPGQAEVNQVHYDTEPSWDDEESVVSKMTCLCIMGIDDPLQPEVPLSIRKCQRAGITLRMITGDSIHTARATAMKCGIIQPGDGYLVLDGQEFNKRIRDASGEVQQHLLDSVWPRLRVLARASPTDKYTLLKGIVDSKLNSGREVVAVTGDDTNDGPSLQRADVGVAMEISGTEVAKAASDIVIVDDSFNSILTGVTWGRNVRDGIARVLQFLLAFKIVVVLIVSLTTARIVEATPITFSQLSWMILVVQPIAAVALATDRPLPELMNQQPFGRTKSLITRTMLKNIIGQVIYQLSVIGLLLYYGHDLFDVDSGMHVPIHARPSVHFTIIFNTFVMMTLFNEFNSRCTCGQRNVFADLEKNEFFTILVVTILGTQMLIVQFGGQSFRTAALTMDQWLWCFFFGCGVLVWGQLVTCIPTSLRASPDTSSRGIGTPV